MAYKKTYKKKAPSKKSYKKKRSNKRKSSYKKKPRRMNLRKSSYALEVQRITRGIMRPQSFPDGFRRPRDNSAKTIAANTKGAVTLPANGTLNRCLFVIAESKYTNGGVYFYADVLPNAPVTVGTTYTDQAHTTTGFSTVPLVQTPYDSAVMKDIGFNACCLKATYIGSLEKAQGYVVMGNIPFYNIDDVYGGRLDNLENYFGCKVIPISQFFNRTWSAFATRAGPAADEFISATTAFDDVNMPFFCCFGMATDANWKFEVNFAYEFRPRFDIDQMVYGNAKATDSNPIAKAALETATSNLSSKDSVYADAGSLAQGQAMTEIGMEGYVKKQFF